VIKVLVTTLILLLSFTNHSFAWDGYDRATSGEIEIGSGNLVREGETIRFYDWEKEENHRGEINSVEYKFHGVTIEIYDLDEKKDRTFEMQTN
jgi:hypothetical protein